MRVTQCDRRASVFIVKELEPFEGWGRFLRCSAIGGHSLHYPCRHALAGCAAASIEWAPYVYPVYKQEAVFKVYEMEFSPIPDESMWAEWHGTRLCSSPAMCRKATRRPVSTRF
ncbi:hypothetical protein Ahy_A03g011163 isoform B [Arachis hypogaea]|uniref:SWIM-type domain-containing protein n=1 Tax=Arachis hypogaea TaxID=3818 RepID=A0A445DPU3_ARAHY|nr:hypothetical protein Ahy_A03g011163 isoform B [Arachis hypogaea]